MFPGDESKELFDMQHGMYGQVCVALLDAACKRYMAAEETLQLKTADGEAVRALTQFDHRVLQGAHDLIAAAYRFKYLNLPLFPEPLNPQNIELDWMRFATKEIEKLVADPLFCRAVIISVIHANTSQGRAAEYTMEDTLRNRYYEMTQGGSERWERWKSQNLGR